MNHPVDAALEGLAAARLTRLIQADQITAPLRERALDGLEAIDRKRHPEVEGESGPIQAVPLRGMAEELLGCAWCTSIWAAAGLELLRALSPRLHAVVIRILAGSQCAGLLAQVSDRLEG